MKNVSICWPWQVPEKIHGVAVVVDILAATSNMSILLSKGVKTFRIASDTTIQNAKKEYPQSLLIGESNTLGKDFFDYPNSARILKTLDMSGKEIIYMSNNGSRVIELALQHEAAAVYAASYVNLSNIISILKDATEPIILLPSGEISPGLPQETEEDLLFSEFLSKILRDQPADLTPVIKRSREVILGVYGLKAERSCAVVLSVDAYPVVPRCRPSGDGYISVRVS